jgi:hypothetical protein
MLRPEGRGGSLAILTSNHYARLKLLVAECWIVDALVYRFIKTHTYLIIKNDKCQNTKFKSNLNFISLRLIKMSKILIGVRYFEI